MGRRGDEEASTEFNQISRLSAHCLGDLDVDFVWVGIRMSVICFYCVSFTFYMYHYTHDGGTEESLDTHSSIIRGVEALYRSRVDTPIY